MSHPRFSTNVRINHRLLRAAVAPLGWLAPALAARLLARIFCTPPRPSLTAEQSSWRAAGHRERLLVGTREVELMIWGTPGPVALLVHGWGGHGLQWTPYLRPLLDAGFQVVTYDAPAHGASPGRLTNLPELIATLESVARRFPPQALLAHSVGAVAATVAMARGLGAGQAVFLAPTDDPWTFLDRAAEALGLPIAIAGRVRARFERRFALPPRALVASSHARGLRVPLLAFHDVADREVPLAHGERLVAAWPGARLEATRGLGHRRIVNDPAVVAAAVGFLGRPAAAGASRIVVSAT